MHQSGTSSNGIPGRVMDYEWMRLLATILVVVGHSSYWIITTTHGGVYYGQDEHLWIDPVYFSAVSGWSDGCLHGFTGFICRHSSFSPVQCWLCGPLVRCGRFWSKKPDIC